MKKSIFLLYLLLFSSTLMADDSWPKPKNGGYIKVAQWWLVANQHFTDQGRIDPNITNGLYFTNIYGEYGITEKLTGTVYFPFFARSLFNNTVSNTTGEILQAGEAVNSVGDLDLGLRYNLFQKGSTALSVGLQLGLPLGETAGGSEGALQTGDGEFNQFLSVELGQGLQFGNTSGWTKAYIGVNNRTQGFSDEFRYGVEAGITVLNRKVSLIGRLYGVESFNNGILPIEATGTSIFANNTEHLTVAPEVAFHFTEKMGISAGFATPLSGRLIYANTAYNVSLPYTFKLRKVL